MEVGEEGVRVGVVVRRLLEWAACCDGARVLICACERLCACAWPRACAVHAPCCYFETGTRCLVHRVFSLCNKLTRQSADQAVAHDRLGWWRLRHP